jgi:hypothetical protein
MVGKTVGM